MKYLTPDKYAEYERLLSRIESSDNPNAKAKTSSASGRFQFIKSTWIGLGYPWAEVFNDKLQYEALDKLTSQNARTLDDAGCAINFATLYGAHFLGAGALLAVMRGRIGDSIDTVTTPAQRKANPTILKGTIKDFCDWLERKTGDSVYRRYTAGGWVSGPDAVVPPVEPKRTNPIAAVAAIIVLFGGFIAAKAFGLF